MSDRKNKNIFWKPFRYQTKILTSFDFFWVLPTSFTFKVDFFGNDQICFCFCKPSAARGHALSSTFATRKISSVFYHSGNHVCGIDIFLWPLRRKLTHSRQKKDGLGMTQKTNLVYLRIFQDMLHNWIRLLVRSVQYVNPELASRLSGCLPMSPSFQIDFYDQCHARKA